MAQQKMSPFLVSLVKGLVFLALGALMVVQPWLAALSWLGWLIIACAVLIVIVMGVRIVGARRMVRSTIATFSSGNAIYAKGLRVDGIVYDFSTFGAELRAATFDCERLLFKYSFYSKKGGRVSETVSFSILPEETQKALAALQQLGLPSIAEAEQLEQEAMNELTHEDKQQEDED